MRYVPAAQFMLEQVAVVVVVLSVVMGVVVGVLAAVSAAVSVAVVVVGVLVVTTAQKAWHAPEAASLS